MKRISILTVLVVCVLLLIPNLAKAELVAAGTIWAAQFYPVGEFHVRTEATGLRVWIFPTTTDWDMILSHVAVYGSPCDFPQTSKDPCPSGTWDEFTVWGNPKIGHFMYGDESATCSLAGHSIFIPYSEIDGGLTPGPYTLYIAIHAEVVQCLGGEVVPGPIETGWAGPCDQRWSPGEPLDCRPLGCVYKFGKNRGWHGFFIEFDMTVPTPAP